MFLFVKLFSIISQIWYHNTHKIKSEEIMEDIKKNRVVIKIGSNSLMHPETGKVDYLKIERLAMELSDLKNKGYDVCLVSSGAIAVGRQTMGIDTRPKKMPEKQALASIGQNRLMTIYERAFNEFNQLTGQILLTKNTILDNVSRKNAQNAFEELFKMDVIPIVNANDTISTYDIQFGDNDTLSAIVSYLVRAERLILLSDIDGLYTADPHKDPDAKLIPKVDEFNEELFEMAGTKPGSDVGTGGMRTKLIAAKIATKTGTDMVIANAKDVRIIHDIIEGDFKGTFFPAHPDKNYDVLTYIESTII